MRRESRVASNVSVVTPYQVLTLQSIKGKSTGPRSHYNSGNQTVIFKTTETTIYKMVRARSLVNLNKPSEIIYGIRETLKKNEAAIKQAILLRNKMDDLLVRFERARKNGQAGFLSALPNSIHVLKVVKSAFCIYGLRLTYQTGVLGEKLYIEHGVRWSDDMASDDYDATQHDDAETAPPGDLFTDDDDNDDDETTEHELSILSLNDDTDSELELSVLDDEDVAIEAEEDNNAAAAQAIPIFGRDN